jgi:K+/H+ antiporter YhaU regulatory subunit KhtT
MAGKPDPKPTVRETARRVDRVLANFEARKAELATAIAIVRNLKAIQRKCDVLPDLVKRR